MASAPLTSNSTRASELRQWLRARSRQFFPNENAEDFGECHVSSGKCVAYGALDFAKTPVQLLIVVHLTTFYQQLGASLGSIAFFTAMARCFDVVTDPLMASVSDGFKSRFGRRRPFILFGGLVYGSCLFGLCAPPASVAPGVWFGFFYIAFFLTDTVVSVPHNALGQEVTSDTDQRRKVFMIAKVFEAVGMIVAAVLPVFVGSLLPDVCALPSRCDLASEDAQCLHLRLECDGEEDRRDIMAVGVTFGLYAALSGIICSMFIAERPTKTDSAEGQTFSSFGTGIGALDEVLPGFLSMLRNKPFRAMIAPWILDKTIVAMLSALLPFFVQYVISPEFICLGNRPPIPETSFQCSSRNLLGVGLVGLLLSAIVAMPVWQLVAQKVGDYRTWLAFNFLNAATTILFIFGQSTSVSIILTIFFAMLNGVPLGANFLTDNILGLVIDYDELRTGVRTEAAFTMFASFIPKIVSIPASAFPLTVLALAGFKEPVGGAIQDQPASVRWCVRVMFSVIPTVLALTSFVLKAMCFPFKDLKKADAEIKVALALRKQGEPYRDPLTGAFRQQAPLAIDGLRYPRAEILLAHFSGVRVVQRLRAEGGRFLVRHTAVQFVIILCGTAMLAISTVASMAAGMLENGKLSWLPSVLVLASGVGVLASLVAILRLRAACALRKLLETLPSAYLDQVCWCRREVVCGDLPAGALRKISEWNEEAFDMVGASSVG